MSESDQTESAKDFWTLPSLNEPGSTTQATSPRRAIRRGQASGLLLVVHVSDNVGDVLVAFLLLLDEGGVVQARVLEFYLFLGFFLGFLGASDHIAIGGHLALGFRVRFLERHEFGICDFRRHYFFFSCGLDCARRGGGIGTRVCAPRGKLQGGIAFRANDRVLIEIVKSRAATAAVALSTELGFHHGPVPLAVENGAFRLAS